MNSFVNENGFKLCGGGRHLSDTTKVVEYKKVKPIKKLLNLEKENVIFVEETNHKFLLSNW